MEILVGSVEDKVWVKYKLLETLTCQYDKILFFPFSNLLQEFCRTKLIRNMKRKTLVLSLSQIDMELDNVTFWQLTRDEAERLMTFYYTYEFADNFFLLPSQNENYAFLYNFVKTGILSVEEFFQVLLN